MPAATDKAPNTTNGNGSQSDFSSIMNGERMPDIRADIDDKPMPALLQHIKKACINATNFRRGSSNSAFAKDIFTKATKLLRVSV